MALDYDAWEQSVPPEFCNDPLWKVTAYRLSLFAADTGWHDATRLAQDRRTIRVSDQLYRALGSMAANIAEGFSRGSHKDRVRFYEYALGSARESRGWYYVSRHVLTQAVVEQRYCVLNQIIRLLLSMIPDQRGYTVREEPAAYALGDSASDQ
ncbi:MAG: four helix bundle protein [Armatimonadetes bacterium]|nr:four helix bundle protein [Armatimonadota bacterium]